MIDATDDWMQTYFGGRFYPLNPELNKINIFEIAHALSNLCRFGGHVKEFYSVAEHCVNLSHVVSPENSLAALLHDATEAYVVDVPRPIKKYLNNYRDIEDNVAKLIADKYQLDSIYPDEVREADTRILLNERNALIPRHETWGIDEVFEPLENVTINCYKPKSAEWKYIARFDNLVREAGLGTMFGLEKVRETV